MTYPLTFVELFAGVGGLSLGLETAGWKCVGHAEWESFPRRVLKHRWPDVPLWGDVSKLNGRDIVAEVGPFTMLTFGAPCQDFSVAGKRSGLDGERSVLVMDAMRIWEESGAPLALYENVVGMLSSNKGEDFAAILSVLIGSNVPVPARGWKGGGGIVRGRTGVAAWRVLDAQYFGVPQRRRRVFVLCSRDPRIDPAEVLSLAEGVSGHSPKGKRARQGAPAGTGAGVGGEGRDGGVTFAVRTANTGANGWGVSEETSHTLDLAQGQAVVHTAVLASETALAINISAGEPRLSDVMGTLGTEGTGRGSQMTAVLSFQPGFVARGEGPRPSTEVFPTLGAGTTGDQAPHVLAFDSTFGHNANVFTDCAPPVKVGSGEGIASPPAVLAFDAYNQQVTGEVSKTLGVGSDYSHIPIAFGLELANSGSGGNRGYTNPGEPMPTIGTGGPHGVVSTSIDKWARGVGGPAGSASETSNMVVTYSTPAIGDIREDSVASTITKNSGGGGETQNPAFVLTYDARGNGDGSTVNTLGASNTGNIGDFTPLVVAPTLTSANNPSRSPQSSEVTQQVAAVMQAEAILMAVREGKPGGGKGPLLSAERKLTLGTGNDQVLFTRQAIDEYAERGVSSTVSARDYKSATDLVIASVPRRLTPVECERLMGWPDNWTNVPDEKGKPAPDTARYKACGNGVASPVSAWIGFQLKAALTKHTL